MEPSLSLTGWDQTVCVVALLGSMVFGIWLSVRARSAENSAGFFLAGRRLTWPVVGASLYATNIGAEHLVGLSGDSYRYGLRAGAVELTTAICLGFAAAVLFPYYIRNRVFTIPEFLNLRYGSAARTAFSGLMLVICIMTKMAFTLYAGALVLHSLLGWEVMAVVVALGLACAALTMIGGFAAVAYTDTVQTSIMIVGCGIMLLLGLHQVGGWDNLWAMARQHIHIAGPLNDPNYPFWGIIAGAVYGGVFYWGIDQVNVQRVLGARDMCQARWGAMFAVLLKLTPVFIFALPGVIAYALYPGLDAQQSKQTFVVLLNRLCPTGIRGLVLAALLAALISSLDAVMNSVSTMAVRDFVLRHRPQTSERAQVFLGRLAILAATALGIGAAWLVYRTPGGLYKYLQTISVYLVMPITPAIVFGIMSKRINLKAAAASVITGIVLATVYVADELMGAEAGARVFPFLHHTATLNYTYRGLWGTMIITAVLFGVAHLTAPPPRERVEGTTITWGAAAEPFQGVLDWRLHLAILGAATVGLYAWLW
jgi:solute:Na+ symporter, SSS family